VAQRAKEQLILEETNQFTQYRASRVAKLPIDSLQVPREKIINDDAKVVGCTQ